MDLRVVIFLVGSVLAVVFSEKQCEDQRNCTPIGDCPEFRSYVGKLYTTWPLAVKMKAKDLHCDTELRRTEKIIKICCKPNSGLKLLNLETCGKGSQERIANGKIAEVFDYPWMALLGGINGEFHCGGSLIAESYVLTAAHCNSRKKVDFVRVGETDLSTPIDCNIAQGERDCAEPHQDIQVDRFIKHQSYSVSKKKNDIALVKLAKPAQLNYNVRPICLPLPEMVPRELPRKMTITGWGFTEDQDEISQQLRYASLPIVEQNQCQISIRRLSNVYTVDESQVCTADDSGLVEHCSGDSGGPLQYFGNKKYVIHGVIAWGLPSCGKDRAPGVYTKVSHYLNWIIDHLE